MSTLTLRGNVAGTGTFIVESPNSNTNRTLTLPDATTTLVGTDATQTLTNKTLNGGALTVMTTQTASGTEVPFTGIPSWVRRITMNMADVSLTTNDLLSIQLGTSAGWDGVGNYSYAAAGVQNAGATSAIASNVAGAFNLTFASAANLMHGTFVLTLLGSSTWVLSGTQVTPTTYVGTGTVSGRKTLTGTLDRIRLVALVAGTFDSGTVNVMYEG